MKLEIHGSERKMEKTECSLLSTECRSIHNTIAHNTFMPLLAIKDNT